MHLIVCVSRIVLAKENSIDVSWCLLVENFYLDVPEPHVIAVIL